MSSPILRVASVIWVCWLHGLGAAAEAPPAPLERLTVEVDGVVCEYSPGDEALAAGELMENRATYLTAIARHLALEAPLATQEECYLVFAEAGVLVASIGERDPVDALFMLSLIYGGTVSDDIFLVPDSGDIVLYADHHEMVHAEFRSSDVMARYLANVRDYEPAQPGATHNPGDAQ